VTSALDKILWKAQKTTIYWKTREDYNRNISWGPIFTFDFLINREITCDAVIKRHPHPLSPLLKCQGAITDNASGLLCPWSSRCDTRRKSAQLRNLQKPEFQPFLFGIERPHLPNSAICPECPGSQPQFARRFVDGGVNKAGMSTAAPDRSEVHCGLMHQG